MIEKQRKEEGEAYIPTVLFDDQTEVLYDRTAADRIEPMNDRQYYVRGVRLFWMLLAEQFIILQMFISMPRKMTDRRKRCSS